MSKGMMPAEMGPLAPQRMMPTENGSHVKTTEKRRERIRAMRVGVYQAGSSTTDETSASHSELSNPFGETCANLPVQGEPPSAQRFGFYTDPMAAFSTNKKSNMYSRPPGGYHASQSTSVSHHCAQFPSPGNQERPPHFQAAYSPNQMRHRAPNPFNAHGSYRGPLPATCPPPSHQVMPPGPPISYNNFPSSASTRGNFPCPGFEQVGGQGFTPEQGRGQWMHRGPNPGNFPRPGFEQVDGPRFTSDQRGGQWVHQRPNPGYNNPGRGNCRDSGNNTSSNSGRGGGGRGRGHVSHQSISAQEKPHLFYSKSMVEDPWKFLEPIDFNVPGSSSSWLPKSITMKKQRVTESSPRQPKQEYNLAEYLAASLSETVNDAENAS